MTYPKFCRDCLHSRVKLDKYRDNKPTDELRCIHPNVNADSEWALTAIEVHHTKECTYERGREGWFAPCGKRGRLWEPKWTAATQERTS